MISFQSIWWYSLIINFYCPLFMKSIVFKYCNCYIRIIFFKMIDIFYCSRTSYIISISSISAFFKFFCCYSACRIFFNFIMIKWYYNSMYKTFIFIIFLDSLKSKIVWIKITTFFKRRIWIILWFQSYYISGFANVARTTASTSKLIY